MPHVDDGRLRTLWLCERCGSVTDGGPHKCKPVGPMFGLWEHKCGTCRWWTKHEGEDCTCKWNRGTRAPSVDWYCPSWEERNATD